MRPTLRLELRLFITKNLTYFKTCWQKSISMGWIVKLLLFLAFLTSAFSVRADWINLTGAETARNIAEITVNDDHVRINLEVFIGDLDVFNTLVPDDWLKDASDRPPLEERLAEFSANTLRIEAGGDTLPVTLQLVEPRTRVDRQSPFAGMINPITRQRVPEAPADKRVLYAELIYPFEGKPDELIITPPVDDQGRAIVTIGFIAYHKAVPIIDFRYLGSAARLMLDWQDPWYTRFENQNLKRHHKSALMSFLYVEPFEVRHEILTRVKDLEQWMDLGLRGSEFIEVDELEPLKQRIGEFLLTRNPVDIDGQSLKPILDRTNFVKVALTGIQILERPERLDLSTAIVGVIITYLTDGLPQEVHVTWELFTDQIDRVPVSAIDPAGPLSSFVDREANVHTWTNFLKNYQLPTVDQVALDKALTTINFPAATVACLLALIPVLRIWKSSNGNSGKRNTMLMVGLALVAGSVALYPYARVPLAKPAQFAPSLTQAQSEIILQSLLKNVYRAFDFRDEEDVYDKLAISVSGEMLRDIYLQSRKSLEVQRAGGAQAKVKEVEVLEAEVASQPDRPLAQTFRARWTAMGTVGHWGHIHSRKNLYDGLITVDPVEGNWKITDLELLEEKRIDPNATVELGGDPAASNANSE